MNESIRVQGRDLFASDLAYLKELIADHPDWHRTRLSREICEVWSWRDEAGHPKDMACRTLLLKLERLECLKLPPRKRLGVNHQRGKTFQPVWHDTSALETPLAKLQPIQLVWADRGAEAQLWQTLLTQYHYLGFTTRVGQSLRYLALAGDGRPVAALLFGAAAWKAADRDVFIGWTEKQRERNLSRIINNMRFLIPPWVKSPHLASHILALTLRSLRADWRTKYGFEPVLVETFVEQVRFKGTCYKAANWQWVGSTTGRTRQDRGHQIKVPRKDIYV